MLSQYPKFNKAMRNQRYHEIKKLKEKSDLQSSVKESSVVTDDNVSN